MRCSQSAARAIARGPASAAGRITPAHTARPGLAARCAAAVPDEPLPDGVEMPAARPAPHASPDAVAIPRDGRGRGRSRLVQTAAVALLTIGLVSLTDPRLPLSQETAITVPSPTVVASLPVPVEVVRAEARPATIVTGSSSPATPGLGSTKDELIDAADDISRHVSGLTLPGGTSVGAAGTVHPPGSGVGPVAMPVPVPVAVVRAGPHASQEAQVRILDLPAIDTTRLPAWPQPTTRTTVPGMLALAAQSLAVTPATLGRGKGRGPTTSAKPQRPRQVAGFLRRSDVPTPVLVVAPHPVFGLLQQGVRNADGTPSRATQGGIVVAARMAASGR